MGAVYRPLRPFTFDGIDYGYEGMPEFLPADVEEKFSSAVGNLLSANYVRREYVADAPKAESRESTTTPTTPDEPPPSRPEKPVPPPFVPTGTATITKDVPATAAKTAKRGV